jgi:putative ABC transport system permease protein
VHHLATISLGMAAVTAVVSLMLALAFRPLPFRDYTALVQVWHRVESGAPMQGLSGRDLQDIDDSAGVFSAFGGYINILQWARDDDGKSAGPLRTLRMEPSAFRAMDLQPILGAPIDAASGLDGGAVWIGHRLWQSRYGGRTSVVGETIRLAWNEAGANETPVVIAGVLPPDIRLPFPAPFFDEPIDVWSVLPADMRVRWADNRSFFALGRLQGGRTIADAEAVLTSLADRRTGPSGRRHRPVVRSFDEIASGPARRTLGLLAAGVGLVVLLAFMNLASLTVAEGSRRRTELAVRAALGAGGWRIWRDLLADHLAVTTCALAVGVPLSWLTMRVLTRLLTAAEVGPSIPQAPPLNVTVIVSFAACALIAAVVWASLTAGRLHAGEWSLDGNGGGLSLATRSGSADRGAKLLRLGVLSLQACVGIALMELAVSLARSYVRLTAADLGPAPDRTVFFSVRPTGGGAPTAAQAAELTSQVRSRLLGLPGVQVAAVADMFPPRGSSASFMKPGDAPDSPRATTSPVTVSHDFFGALGIPILFGRGFDDTDRFGGKPVVVIDLEMARRNWTSPEDAVSLQITFGTRGTFEVIGVAGTFGGYWSQEPMPSFFLSQHQQPRMGNVVILRTNDPSPNIGELARQVLSGLPVPVEVSAPATLQSEWEKTATRPRARMIGMALLALLGIALAAQGVYALTASNVAVRRQELAVRTALGASQPALMWLVLRPLIAAVVIGSIAGVAAIIAVERIAPHPIASAISEPAVPLAWGVVGLLMVALLGGSVAARPATRLTSAEWLRR